jgi:DHA1 family tetracycline resistance protein-like MFS transporter
MSARPAPGRANLALLFILATVTLDAIGIGLIFPVMPDLMESVTHGTLSQAAMWGGVLATSYALMQFLFGPIMGNLSDHFGRRPVLLVSLVVMTLDYLAMAVAPSVMLLLITRIVAGIASATYSTANAYIADISEPDQRAKNFGYIGAAFGIGFIAGPMIGGLTAGIDPRAPFWIAAGLAAANVLFGVLVLPESLSSANRRAFTLARANPLASFAAIRRLPGLRLLLWVSFLYAVTFNVWSAVWSYYAKAAFGWNAQWNGLALAGFGVFMVIVQAFMVAPMIRRFGERGTAVTGMVLEVISYLFYGFATSGFWALVFTPMASVGGITGPALQAMMSRATPEDQQGELQGINASVVSLASMLAPLVMTWIFSYFTSDSAPIYLPGAPFLLSATIMVGVVIVFVAGSRALRRA